MMEAEHSIEEIEKKLIGLDVNFDHEVLTNDLHTFIKENDFGFVNLSDIFMKKDFVRAYALTMVYSPKRREVLFRVGS